MSEAAIGILLWTFAALLIAIGVAQLCFMSNAVSGWSAIAVGASLIVVAASPRKKSKNG